MLVKIMAVAIGGALGAVCRLLVTEYFNHKMPSMIPYGTMTVNLVGAFIIGLLMIYFLGDFSLPLWAKFFVITGCLGGLTTFSTFTYEWVALLESAHYTEALIYSGVQLVAGLLFCFLGMSLGRLLF